jgi:translation initiation factor IF-3
LFICWPVDFRPTKRARLGEWLIATGKQTRINGEIDVAEVRLIGAEGEQLGIVSLRQAMQVAEEADLDLVEISPTAKPPVCKVMDFGKFKYQESKKQHEAKLKQKQVQVKEVKFRPGTDEGDYQIKLRNINRFLADGDKVKVTLRFRGREMTHQELGLAQLKRVEADVTEISVTEQFPKMEGRQMIMVLAPKKKK